MIQSNNQDEDEEEEEENEEENPVEPKVGNDVTFQLKKLINEEEKEEEQEEDNDQKEQNQNQNNQENNDEVRGEEKLVKKNEVECLSLEKNQNNEERDEEGIPINQEDGEEEGVEYKDVCVFDMQINDDAYLIIIGKTDENKIFLRLMDKEDQSKPFYHGEFSLEDLRVINQIFNGIDSEDIAFQYLA